MNKFLRVLGLGLMIATFAFVGFAQDRTREVVYKQYTDNFESNDPAKIKLAIDAAKEYIAKFTEASDQPQTDYFKSAIAPLEQKIGELDGRSKAKAESDAWYAQLKALVGTFNTKKGAESFTAGKQAIDKQFQYLDKGFLTTDTIKGHKLDITIGLGTMGFDLAAAKNDTLNNESITYLKSALDQLNSGQVSSTTTFGKTVGYNLENRDNAVGLLNYYIGYIMYYRQSKKADALPYLYKATQAKSASKDFADIYRMIGQFYYDKVAEIDPKRLDVIAKNNNVDNEESLALLAQEKGYADRGADAFARASKMAKDNPKTSKEFSDALRSSLEEIYKFRFDKTDGIDAYVTSVMSKPFPDPATPVQPIVEEKKPETTTPTTTSGTTSTTNSTTKPAATTGTKPATTTPAKTTTPITKPATTTTPANGKTSTTTTNSKTTPTAAKTTTPAKKPRRK